LGGLFVVGDFAGVLVNLVACVTEDGLEVFVDLLQF
jgi:hypothetical protein